MGNEQSNDTKMIFYMDTYKFIYDHEVSKRFSTYRSEWDYICQFLNLGNSDDVKTLRNDILRKIVQDHEELNNYNMSRLIDTCSIYTRNTNDSITVVLNKNSLDVKHVEGIMESIRQVFINRLNKVFTVKLECVNARVLHY